MTSKILILTSAFLVLIGKAYGQYCTNESRYTEVQFFDSTEITIGNDIQFGIANDHVGNPYTLLMDIYYPNLTIDPSPERPFIMIVHGGGFQGGDKNEGGIVDLCIFLAERGYVCASINYRLGWNTTNIYNQYILNQMILM